MAGVRVHRWALPSEDVTRTHAVLVTTPMRTALDPARTLSPVDAVVALDALVRTGLIRLADVRSAVATATGRGCRRARDAPARADGVAESPRRRGCGWSCTPPPSRPRSPSAPSATPRPVSSRGWTPPGPSTASRSSTRAPGTASRRTWPGTGRASTG